jgi:hypothetical protein
MKSKNKQRFGLFYMSNGRWTGPYAGLSFTQHSLERNPIRSDIGYIKNYVLKSRIEMRKVVA